jgi:hypothetical protein
MLIELNMLDMGGLPVNIDILLFILLQLLMNDKNN